MAKHTKNIRGDSSSSKITNFSVQSGSGDEEHTAAGTLAFHCVKTPRQLQIYRQVI
jgi:hypothetical protein